MQPIPYAKGIPYPPQIFLDRLCFCDVLRVVDYIGPLHKVFNPSLKTKCPDWIEVEGVGLIRIRRPELHRKDWRGVPRYKGLRSASRKRYFWWLYKREYPKKYEQYVNAGKWLTPEEGEKVYGTTAQPSP